MTEIIVDSFAGGGGASLGISWALGRSPDIAINHDREAITLHTANHPESEHFAEDVWKVDPVQVCRGRPVGLMWLSPDCTHFSKAKGGKPVKKKIRGLAQVAVRWAAAVRPRVIVLENVEEFREWGPVLRETSRPCPRRKGRHFRFFVRQLERHGYRVEHRELRASDFGAPTSRKRLFLIARCDGEPIRWPTPTHGLGRAHPWHTAAECIDWSIPCPSIFERKKALAENTLRRIARGIRRFVIDAPRPFIVRFRGDSTVGNAGTVSIDEPMPTVTANSYVKRPGGCAPLGIVVPTLIQTGYGEDKHRNGGAGQPPRSLDLHQPLGTVVACGVKHALVSAFLAKHYGGHETPGSQLSMPFDTVTARDHHALVTSNLVKLHGTTRDGHPVTDPMPTVLGGGNHIAEVRAFLVAYYGTDQNTGNLFHPTPTLTAKDRWGLVTVAGTQYLIADIGMRMLAPRELYRAQGFPDSYQINIRHTYTTKKGIVRSKPLSKSAQVRMVGNSVPPQLAEAIVRENVELRTQERAA